jgi:hypothetical protein
MTISITRDTKPVCFPATGACCGAIKDEYFLTHGRCRLVRELVPILEIQEGSDTQRSGTRMAMTTLTQPHSAIPMCLLIGIIARVCRSGDN